jgi:cytochrome b561
MAILSASKPLARPAFGGAFAWDGTGRYTAVAMALHWITAALALATLPIAWTATAITGYTHRYVRLINTHKSIGLTLFLIVLVRLAWRYGHRAPHLQLKSRAIAVVSHISHWGLYCMFLYMPVSGFMMSAFGGHPVYFWGQRLPRLPHDQSLADLGQAMHGYGQWAVYGLVLMHVGATGWHTFIERDGVLDRMLPPQAKPAARGTIH